MPSRPVLGLSIAAALATSTLVAAPAASAGTSCVPPPVAHRGDSARAPENTLPAFRTALRAGVRRVEMDVRFSRGDVPVVIHDETVDRTTDGAGEVSSLDLVQLRGLDAGGWFGAAYRGTRVPTLYQALSLVRRKGGHAMVELKTLPSDAQMAQFLNRVRWLSMTHRITVTSFDGPTITAVRQAAPDLRTAIIDNPRYRRADSVLQFGRTYVVNSASVTETRAARWRRAGIAVRPWTVDTVRGWRRMAYDKAEAVVTNRPKAYLTWARRRCR